MLIEKLAKDSDKLSGADIEGVCQRVGLSAIRERKSKDDKLKISHRMFEDVIRVVKSSK